MKKVIFAVSVIAASALSGCGLFDTGSHGGSTRAAPSYASPTTVKESEDAVNDAAITTKVKSAFIREKLFGKKAIAPMSINVKTYNGAVYLSGTATSKAQVRNAVRIARSVEGVTDVDASRVIVVKQQ